MESKLLFESYPCCVLSSCPPFLEKFGDCPIPAQHAKLIHSKRLARAPKSFRIRTYELARLHLLWMQHLQNTPGGGGVPRYSRTAAERPEAERSLTPFGMTACIGGGRAEARLPDRVGTRKERSSPNTRYGAASKLRPYMGRKRNPSLQATSPRSFFAGARRRTMRPT
jgi:hypothetical protein